MKVTIYSKGEFMGNIIATETKLKSFSFRKYAQYPNALEIVHTPKRKRTTFKKMCTPCGGSPDILILEGWNNPQPAGMFAGNESTHMSFDKKWQSDFDKFIDNEIESKNLKVILDTRGHDKYYEAIREHKEEA